MTGPGAVVLVEGVSDRAALELLARRRGWSGDGIAFVAMQGYTNVGRELRRIGAAPGAGPRVAGLVDRGAETFVRRAIGHSGIDAGEGRGGLAAAGFFVCDRDLEDELLRALGVDAILAVVDAEGELEALRRLRNQVAHRDDDTHTAMLRFLSARSGRKERYAPLLAAALPADRVPAPLAGVLAHVGLRPAGPACVSR